MSKLTDQDIIESYRATGDLLRPDQFPELSTLSAGFFYQFIPVAKKPDLPEIVFLPPKATTLERVGILATWNSLWESAQYRKQVFNESKLFKASPKMAAWLKALPEENIYLVTDTKTRYHAYAPLFHLLPKHILDRHGLPAMKRPLWPVNDTLGWHDRLLPPDAADRLSRAFAEHIWPHLDSRSGFRMFSSDDPLILLSHSLDYWLPYSLMMIEDRMRDFRRVEPETPKQHKMLAKARELEDPDVDVQRPRCGGTLWEGEEDANCATSELVDLADRSGQLRGIIESIRSSRVKDDFSSQWSFAKEDFERKLYRKRAKVRVSFVEIDDTMAVHSPRSEYTDNLLWQDFSAFLDAKERQIIVCLRNGTTKLGDIASTLGYANHSPISKALAKIRKKAAEFLNLN